MWDSSLFRFFFFNNEIFKSGMHRLQKARKHAGQKCALCGFVSNVFYLLIHLVVECTSRDGSMA